MSYNFSTGFTTALLFGNEVKSLLLSPGSSSRFDEIQAHLQAVAALWAHPMVLPSVLLSNHLYRAEIFCYNVLESRILETEDELGVVRAGRLSWKRDKNLIIEKPIHESKSNIRELTSRMNTDLTEIIFLIGVTEWDCVAIEFLAKTTEKVSGLLEKSHKTETGEIREFIEYMSVAAKVLLLANNKSKERMQAHLNVVC